MHKDTISQILIQDIHFTKRPQLSLGTLCWSRQRYARGSAGHHGCEEFLDLAAVRAHTAHMNKHNMLKIIWGHRISKMIPDPISPSPPPLCLSLWSEGLICVISCSNRTGVTQGLIDMQWDNPTSATNISVCPASKPHHPPALSVNACTIASTSAQFHPNDMRGSNLRELIWHIRNHVCHASKIKQWDTFCMMELLLTLTLFLSSRD